jgi:ferredoxin
VPLLAAMRTDAAEPIAAGAAHLLADGATPDAAALLARLRDDASGALRARRRTLPPAAGVRVVLCTCNGSVHHRGLVDELAAGARALPGVVDAVVVNAACQPEATRAIAAGPIAGDAAGVVLAACLCCPIEIVCGSCSHQRARAKRQLFAGEGLPPHLVETINLRDEVLNQAALAGADALRLGRRALGAAVARALAGIGPCPDGLPLAAADGDAPGARADRTAPLPLPGRGTLAATIDAARCRGCGTCVRNCPQETIALTPRAAGIPLARVDAAACTLCGTCLAVCPTGAPCSPFAGHRQVRDALAAAFAGERS